VKQVFNIIVLGIAGALAGLLIGFALNFIWSFGWIMYWGGESRGHLCDVKRTGEKFILIIPAIITSAIFVWRWGRK